MRFSIFDALLLGWRLSDNHPLEDSGKVAFEAVRTTLNNVRDPVTEQPISELAEMILCTFLDEMTGEVGWALQLLGQRHTRYDGADLFFDAWWGGAQSAECELMYLCLLLGFKGRYDGGNKPPSGTQAIENRTTEASKRRRPRSIELHIQ